MIGFFNGNGALNVRNGGQVSNADVELGSDQSRRGTVNVDGAASKWTSTLATIGKSGIGSLRVSGGGMVVVNQFIEMARDPLSEATIIVEGVESKLQVADLYVSGSASAAGGTGQLTVQGGTVEANNLKVWGRGKININGGTLDLAGTLATVDDSVLHLDGGTLRLRNTAALQAFPHTFDWTGGTLNFTEGGLAIGSTGLLGPHVALNSRMNLNLGGMMNVSPRATLLGGGSVNAAGGTNDGAISMIGGDLSYSQPAVNNGNLDGLRATLTFPGDGIKNNIGLINNGTLTLANVTVNGDIHSPTGSTINVAAGVVFNGLVSGGGSFPGAGTVIFNGGYSPGDSPASVSFGGGVALGTGGAIEMELGGATEGAQYDSLTVGGVLLLNGTLEISLLDGFQPSIGDYFDLFDYQILDGRFQRVNLPPLPAGHYWDVTQLYANGSINVSAVPEPAAILTCLATCVCLTLLGKRRARFCKSRP